MEGRSRRPDGADADGSLTAATVRLGTSCAKTWLSELGPDVNNLFDKLGFRGGGGLFPILSSTQAVFNGTALYGRTVTGSIRYRF